MTEVKGTSARTKPKSTWLSEDEFRDLLRQRMVQQREYSLKREKFVSNRIHEGRKQ